jgi:hypothetical protein
VEHLSTIILRSYSPAGELIRDWDVESVLPAAEYYVQVDFAGNPAGDFAIAVRYPDPVTTFREVILLGNTANVDELSLWPSPFEPSVRRIVELSWDGEAFAVHYVELGGAQPLSLMRLSPAGEMLSEPLEVGPPGSLIAADSQFRTDPESGRSLRITGATVGVGVAGHERDGSWVGGAPLGEFTRFITDPTTESYLGVPPALAVTPEASLLAWNAAYVGLYFQFVNGALEALAPARLLPGAALENASIFRSDEPLAATVRDGRFYLFMKNELGVDRLEVTSEGVVEQINLIQNPGAACLEGSGRCVRNWYGVAGAAQAITYEGELWLGLEENTRGEVYRVLRAEAHCNYPSTWTPEE